MLKIKIPITLSDWGQGELLAWAAESGLSAEAVPVDSLPGSLADCNVLVADADVPVGRALISAMPQIRAVLCPCIGVDNVDRAALAEAGALLANIPDYCVVAVAEFTIGLLYALTRRIPLAAARLAAGAWAQQEGLAGTELFGKTLGVVAYGNIGADVARQAKGLGMKVLVHRRHMDEAAIRASGYAPAPLDDLLAQSDFVTVHAPLTEETRGLIGAERIARMKDGAYLVNVGRGGVVDEAALLGALRGGKLAGAALDVMAQEPLPPGDPLLGMVGEKLILTPHIAWNTEEAGAKLLGCLKRQLLALAKGEPPEHLMPWPQT
ncbi:MAG: D-glycerate dehydrogenase [Clostridiales Family XIII bacterium]|jgi:D-3-phosphoglycerate dehydrogenase|nr:D-glycerate dehydrogenase [Clostridiales Family XIII bacterium]